MIVGFSIQNLSAERNQSKSGQLKINHKHTIEEVEEARSSAFDKPLARIRFSFDTVYTQNGEQVADIGFKGAVLWQKDAADVLAAWDEDETIDDDVRTAVSNHVFKKCLTQAIGLADTLDLPSPVPLPRVQKKKGQ